VRFVLVLDVLFAASVGAVVCAAAPGMSRGSLALVLVVAYATARVLAPPGPAAEITVLVGGALAVYAVRRYTAAHGQR